MARPKSIPWWNRKVIRNPDKSISTVNSYTVEQDGKHYVVPGVNETRKLSGQEAMQRFRKTGEYFQRFERPELAEKFGQRIHLVEGHRLQPKRYPIIGNQILETKGMSEREIISRRNAARALLLKRKGAR